VHSHNGSTLESSEHGTITHSGHQGYAELELSQGLPKVECMAKLHDPKLMQDMQTTDCISTRFASKHRVNVAGTLYIWIANVIHHHNNNNTQEAALAILPLTTRPV